MGEALIREIQELRLLMGSPRDPDGRVFAQLGNALRRNGELDEAVAVLRDGLEAHPHFTPGHLTLGWVAQERGDLDEALARFQRTLELDPENPFGLLGAGRILELRGDDEGGSLVGQARALHPSVEEAAPALPAPMAALHELPFRSLAQLAPEAPRREELDDLPFVSLSDLAPDEPTGVEGSDPLEELPFVALSELRPDAAEAEEEDVAAPEPPLAIAEEEDDDDATPVTRTMAELLVRQGLVERAVQVYEQLQSRSPDDPELERRLEELRGMAGEPGTGAEDVRPRPPSAMEERSIPGETADEVHPSLAVSEPDPGAPSPFGWEDDGEDPGEPPPASSAGAYFGKLLAWTPGNPAREADEASAPEPPRDAGGS